MKHLFRATRIGYPKAQDGVWFDAAKYTLEQALAQFKTYKGITQKGFPYTGYEYDGIKYHDITYLGIYKNSKMPHSNDDLFR